MNLSGKKLLVIGGAGFIGSHTVDRLIEEDVAEIIIYDNFTRGREEHLANALKDPRVRVFPVGGDILHRDILDAAMEGVDGVFHFAALWLLHCHDYPRSAFEVNVHGTFNVLEACVKHKVQRLVYSSSASVYGDAVQEPMDEDHPFNNKNFYGATKICGEAMARAIHHRYGLPYVGLRYMNVYGPRADNKGAYISVIMKMLDAIESGSSPTVHGDGSDAFDFIEVTDCAAANVAAMKAEITDRYYNVGTGVKTTLSELATLLLNLNGVQREVRYLHRTNSGLVRTRVGDPARASAELGFTAKVSLQDGLRKLIASRTTCADESNRASAH